MQISKSKTNHRAFAILSNLRQQ